MIYTYNDIKKTDGPDPWWTEIVIKPIVYKLTSILANYTKFTPNQITIISFILGISSAYFFLQGDFRNIIIGALLFELSYIVDCTDGRVARLKGLQSRFGGYLDIITDITKYFLMTLCLVYGQYILTNDLSYFFYGYIFIFLEFIAITNTYLIHIKSDKEEMGDLAGNKFPTMMRIKKFIDPNDRLSYKISAVEAETIAFLIAPIFMKIKLGLIIGSIILIICILLAVIFYFFIKK